MAWRGSVNPSLKISLILIILFDDAHNVLLFSDLKIIKLAADLESTTKEFESKSVFIST